MHAYVPIMRAYHFGVRSVDCTFCLDRGRIRCEDEVGRFGMGVLNSRLLIGDGSTMARR